MELIPEAILAPCSVWTGQIGKLSSTIKTSKGGDKTVYAGHCEHAPFAPILIVKDYLQTTV